jgi:hypothetical protein
MTVSIEGSGSFIRVERAIVSPFGTWYVRSVGLDGRIYLTRNPVKAGMFGSTSASMIASTIRNREPGAAAVLTRVRMGPGGVDIGRSVW